MGGLKIRRLDFHDPVSGTWTFDWDGKAVGGRPLPSESQAYLFSEKVIPQIEAAIYQILKGAML